MQMSRHNTKDWSAADDTALALAARSGDAAAFEEIVRRYQGRVYAAAYRVTGNREDALDAAQHVNDILGLGGLDAELFEQLRFEDGVDEPSAIGEFGAFEEGGAEAE
ncbi:MAG TPA: hypothetical protein P5141_11865 [Candidatus Hydrogenedentes bacterium]|nr:hypothetical protein [Candidatus Hydrogenedentota bacterium]